MVLTAFPVGFLAGLFGIGGGLITVPFLFFIFDSLNINQEYLMHLAVGTSFSIIVPTSIISVLTHKKNGSVDFGVIKNYAIFVIIGVLSGTIFAAILHTKSLLLFFTTIVYLCGAYLLNIKDKTDNLKVNFNLIPRIILGFVSGYFINYGDRRSNYERSYLKIFWYPINKAMGSAAAIGSVISLFGALGFLITGSFLKADLPLSRIYKYTCVFNIYTNNNVHGENRSKYSS